MGAQTKAFVKGNVSSIEIMAILSKKLGAKDFSYNIIKEVIDIEELNKIYKKKSFHRHADELGNYQVRKGFICFALPNGNKRKLEYYYNSCWPKYNETEYMKNGLQKMIEADRTLISIGYCIDSKEIIKAIVEEYGGWIDEDTSDCNTFYYVRKKRG